MPRPRTVDDGRVLSAAATVIARVGPHRMTLGDVAAEVGLSPATLLQRFGSKRGLLVAVARRNADGAADLLDRRPGEDPIAALVRGLAAMAATVGSPEELAHHLQLLQLDLSDPDLRALAARHARTVRRRIAELLDAAQVEGLLVPCHITDLAHQVHVTYNGALLLWALDPRGTPGQRVRRDVRRALAPYLHGGGAR